MNLNANARMKKKQWIYERNAMACLSQERHVQAFRGKRETAAEK